MAKPLWLQTFGPTLRVHRFHLVLAVTAMIADAI
jgi:hypothetical protein